MNFMDKITPSLGIYSPFSRHIPHGRFRCCHSGICPQKASKPPCLLQPLFLSFFRGKVCKLPLQSEQFLTTRQFLAVDCPLFSSLVGTFTTSSNSLRVWVQQPARDVAQGILVLLCRLRMATEVTNSSAFSSVQTSAR